MKIYQIVSKQLTTQYPYYCKKHWIFYNKQFKPVQQSEIQSRQTVIITLEWLKPKQIQNQNKVHSATYHNAKSVSSLPIILI